jgi:hypothetical protein
MGRWVLLVLVVGTGAARGQELPEAPVSKATWTTFVGLGAEILADGVTTRVLYQRHYDELNPVAKPFVHAGVPGQIGVSLLGAGAMGGVWFVLHRTHHERIAKWFLRSVAAGEGYNVVRQIAVVRASQGDQAAISASVKSPSERRHTQSAPVNPSDARSMTSRQ